MTRKEQKAKRPEGWAEVKAAYYRRELTVEQASEKLGISRQWFTTLLRRDDPARKSFKHENGVKLGKSRRKWTTYLEREFSDYTLCKMIRLTENCAKCPCNCDGQKNYKDLRAKLIQLVPIAKTASETSEDT